MREYNSFDEIERDLKLLKLQSEVDKEMVRLRYNLAKKSLSPLNIVKRVGVKVFKSALIYKGTSKVLGFVADKFQPSKQTSNDQRSRHPIPNAPVHKRTHP